MKQLITLTAVLLIALPVAGLAQEEAAEKPNLTIESELGTGVEERMPVGTADSFDADVEQVYCWCRVKGAADTTLVKHVWFYEGKEMASVELPVKSASWRTWSSKKILPEWTGQWTVKIIDAAGNELESNSFRIAGAGSDKSAE